MPLPPNVRCGTAGWAYPHWNGVVYSRTPQHQPRTLSLISQYFDMVEVNRTFYQPIHPEVARLWLTEVACNRRFQFTVKLNRSFTHDGVLDGTSAKVFKEGLLPLLRAGKLGCLLMQFPWTFRFTGKNRDYLICLRRAFHEFPLVAEMRHSSWAVPEAIGTGADRHAADFAAHHPHRICAAARPGGGSHTAASVPLSRSRTAGMERAHEEDGRNGLQPFRCY